MAERSSSIGYRSYTKRVGRSRATAAEIEALRSFGGDLNQSTWFVKPEERFAAEAAGREIAAEQARQAVGNVVAGVGYGLEAAASVALMFTGPVGAAAGAYLVMDAGSGTEGLFNEDLDFVQKGHEFYFGEAGTYTRMGASFLAGGSGTLARLVKPGVYARLQAVTREAVTHIDEAETNLLRQLSPREINQ